MKLLSSSMATQIAVSSTVEPSNVSHYEDLLTGCILAIFGNLLISVSLNLQKFTHIKNEERELPIHYTRNPLWWLGVSLMVIGEVGNFSAYGYAPASLVAPLGTTTVVANMFLAAVFLKEKIRPENLFGSALAVVGAILVVAFSPKKEAVLDGERLHEALTQVSFVVYVCIELLFLFALFVLLYAYKMKRVVIYLLIVAIIASFSVISAKAVSSMVQLTFAGTSQLGYFSFYVMVFVMVSTAIIQVKYLNMAMKNFESTIVVPTNFVFFTISAIIAGIVFYKEFYGMTALEIFVFLFGCIMSFVGVYFIVAGRGTAEAVTKVTKEQEPASNSSSPLTVNSHVFPSWLLATVNVGQVQPSGLVTHLVTEDRQTLINEDGDPAVDSSSQETLYSTTESINGPQQNGKTYGAND